MQSNSRVTKYVSGLCLAVGLSVSGIAGAVNPGGAIVKNTYYSDASLTVRVGERDCDCQGRLNSWGQLTMFQTFTAKECPSTDPSRPPGNDGDLPGPPTCQIVYTPYPEAICAG